MKEYLVLVLICKESLKSWQQIIYFVLEMHI